MRRQSLPVLNISHCKMRQKNIFIILFFKYFRSGSRTILLERALGLAMETFPCSMTIFGILQVIFQPQCNIVVGIFVITFSFPCSYYFSGIIGPLILWRGHSSPPGSDLFRDDRGPVPRQRQGLEGLTQAICKSLNTKRWHIK